MNKFEFAHRLVRIFRFGDVRHTQRFRLPGSPTEYTAGRNGNLLRVDGGLPVGRNSPGYRKRMKAQGKWIAPNIRWRPGLLRVFHNGAWYPQSIDPKLTRAEVKRILKDIRAEGAAEATVTGNGGA